MVSSYGAAREGALLADEGAPRFSGDLAAYRDLLRDVGAAPTYDEYAFGDELPPPLPEGLAEALRVNLRPVASSGQAGASRDG